MSVVCPNGHASATADYCDQCGAPIASRAAPPQPTEILPVLDDADTDTSAAPVYEPCPACGAARSGDDLYCEVCGADFRAPPRPTLAWEAVVFADRAQFDRFGPDGVAFPADSARRHFDLSERQVRVGRGGARAGERALDIDLAGEPEDPGISRLHALLERQEDGSYAVRDLGSTNGTTVNDKPLPPGEDATAVRLADGDCIRIGAWTAITIRTRQ
jgi:hypothetical protein